MFRSFFPPLLALALLASCGSPASVHSFYQDHKSRPEVVNFTIPGWLIFLGSSVARPFVRDPETRQALTLARKVKRLQLLVDENGHQVSPAAVDQLTRQAERDGYEHLLYVRDQGTRLQVMVRERGDKLRHLLVVVRDETDLVFLNLKTSIRTRDVAKLVNFFLKEEGEEELPEPEPAVRPELAGIPQV